MTNNLHISYDLYKPGQNYDAVIDRIKRLGSWAKIHKSFWYVKSSMTETQARDAVWAVMDSNDSLYVLNATTGNAAWQNLSPEVSEFIKSHWQRAA